MAERDNLTTRTIPFMELSDGSDASLTAPPAPLPHYLNAEGRAIARFAVEGNVVSKLILIYLCRFLDPTAPETPLRAVVAIST